MVACRQKVYRSSLLKNSNPFILYNRVPERFGNMLAGPVGTMNNAGNAVTAFAGQVQRALTRAVKFDSEMIYEKRFNEGRAFPREVGNGIMITDIITGSFNITNQAFAGIAGALVDDPALGQDGRRVFIRARAGNENDTAAVFRRGKGGNTAGDAGADNQNICLRSFFHVKTSTSLMMKHAEAHRNNRIYCTALSCKKQTIKIGVRARKNYIKMKSSARVSIKI